MKLARYRLFAALALAASAALGLAGCARGQHGDTASTSSDAARPAPVRVASAQRVVLPRHQPLAATVRPVEHAVVAARASGSILRANFALGQSVSAGEVVVTLEASETVATVAAAEALLAQIAGDLARESALLAKGATPADNVRRLADQRTAAAASLEAARARLAYSRITAPFDGVITRKLVNTGDLASPGLPLFEIEGRGGLRAECEVPASLPSPAHGATVVVRLASGRQIQARLAELSGASDPLARTRLAKLDLPADSTANNGDFVSVAWPAGESEALVVPSAALSPLGQMERVFVVSEGRARLRLVKSAGTSGDATRIVAGLDDGETVVVAPAASLRDGQPVEILR